MKLYMFRTVPLSIIRSFSLYTQQWCMAYRFADSLRAGPELNSVPLWSCTQAVSKPLWHIPLLCVQWKTPDDVQRNCPKHARFHSKNKFEKLVHLASFIIRNEIVPLPMHVMKAYVVARVKLHAFLTLARMKLFFRVALLQFCFNSNNPQWSLCSSGVDCRSIMHAAQRHYGVPQPGIEFPPSRNTPFNRTNEAAQLT